MFKDFNDIKDNKDAREKGQRDRVLDGIKGTEDGKGPSQGPS